MCTRCRLVTKPSLQLHVRLRIEQETPKIRIGYWRRNWDINHLLEAPTHERGPIQGWQNNVKC